MIHALAAAIVLAGGGVHTERVAVPSLCPATKPAAAYQWPVEPFRVQHPVRGNFGDPRIIARAGPLGRDAPGTVSYQFHNGVDIVAADGSPVYGVADGTVRYVAFDFVVVGAHHRRFQYWHVIPDVHVGEHVVAGRTILGWIRHRSGHVHLTEIDHGRVANPLEPGHLFPYRDRRPPVVDRVLLAGGRAVAGAAARAPVEVLILAHDEPSLPVPGRWARLPVTPAEVTWSLQAADGRRVAGGVAADFRRTLPRPRAFWQVYARGTYQNAPVAGRRHYMGLPGRYIFRGGGIDTRALAPGRYELVARASDVCGNVGTLAVPVLVR